MSGESGSGSREKMIAEEGLECPVCWEAFDDADNTPYVLWCGHTLCKNCVRGLQWATIKVASFSLQLPMFITCPWCQFLTARFTWKGIIKYPCKNFFLLWIIESIKNSSSQHLPSPKELGKAVISQVPRTNNSSLVSNIHRHHRGTMWLQPETVTTENIWVQWHGRLRMLLALTFQLTAKLPLIFLFLFIILYVLPLSTAVLVLYSAITVMFAIPSFIIIYFSYPSLSWIMQEILG